MISLTMLDKSEFILNSDLIETMEEKPDTTIRLTTKAYYIVSEPMGVVVEKIIAYKRRCNLAPEELIVDAKKRG